MIVKNIMNKKEKIILTGMFVFLFSINLYPEVIIIIISDVDKYLVLRFGLKKYIFSLITGMASGAFLAYSFTILSKKIAFFLLDIFTSLKENNSHIDISSAYTLRVGKKIDKLKEMSLTISIYYLFSHLLFQNNEVLLALSSILFIYFFVLSTKGFLVEYRVQTGLFGTNRTEARELIDFIIKNSDNLDFTDSNGNLRRALLPEAKDAAEERIPGTLGEGAPA